MEAICTICFLNVNYEQMPITRLICGHTFHMKCISTWIFNSNSCPNCRQKIDEDPNFNICPRCKDIIEENTVAATFNGKRYHFSCASITRDMEFARERVRRNLLPLFLENAREQLIAGSGDGSEDSTLMDSPGDSTSTDSTLMDLPESSISMNLPRESILHVVKSRIAARFSNM